MIERISASDLDRHLDEWKELRRQGWSVQALVAPDKKTVVFLASKEV